MDAVSIGRITVYFYGEAMEQWDDSYRLTVTYRNRRSVQAERQRDGSWLPVGGDEELVSLLRDGKASWEMLCCFSAACQCTSVGELCRREGLSGQRAAELIDGDDSNPILAAELMRMLMDEFGMGMEQAYELCATHCRSITAPGIDDRSLRLLQPRTAAVMGLLRRLSGERTALYHNALDPDCRKPVGAVKTGEGVRFFVGVRGGSVEKMVLCLRSDEGEREYDMIPCPGGFAAEIIPSQTPKPMWYSFRYSGESGAGYLRSDPSGYRGITGEGEDFRLTVYRSDFQTPDWFKASVMYQIFPDRFAFSHDDTASRGIAYHRGLGQVPELHADLHKEVRWQPREGQMSYAPDDFYGGTFRGIIEKLDYLKSLGVGVIYLNPIVEARSNHRYDTSDYLRPDPILGSTEDFCLLCREAEKRGIRLILDGVYSHTGADSIYFDRYGSYGGKGAAQSRTSPYFSWYDFHSWPDEYRSWWGFKDLPEVEESREDWQQFIISGENAVMKHWLRLGAGGWRLDVADELPDEVLRLMRTAVKEEKPDAPIIGEVWEDAVVKESYGHRRDFALGNTLDSVMNYPLRSAVLDFLGGRSDAFQLRDFLISQQQNYPKPMYYALMNLLGSHDVDRLLTALAAPVILRGRSREEQLSIEAGIDGEAMRRALRLERLAAAIQFFTPGVPSVYYGDELGMTGTGDPFNRRPVRWDEYKDGFGELHEWYSRLGGLRSREAALISGEACFYALSRDVLAILRHEGEDALLMVANRGEDVSFTLSCPALRRGTVSGEVKGQDVLIVRL